MISSASSPLPVEHVDRIQAFSGLASTRLIQPGESQATAPLLGILVFAESSLPSSMKLISTTTADPDPEPRKNIDFQQPNCENTREPTMLTIANRARCFTLAPVCNLSWKHWAAAGVLSAGLLELPFPLAGPLPPWRTVFAWFGSFHSSWAVLSFRAASAHVPCAWRVSSSPISAACCGTWATATGFATPCFATANAAAGPTLLLIGFSLVLGLYFGLFGLGLALVRRATGSTRLALAFAPFLWTGLDLAAARITSVPWDQLGYSQVDNALVNQIAPWTGVYGISFVLVAATRSSPAACCWAAKPRAGSRAAGPGRLRRMLLRSQVSAAVFVPPPTPAPTATAVLIQPNLDVGDANNWRGTEWDRHIAEFACLAGESAEAYIAGIRKPARPRARSFCPPYPTIPISSSGPNRPRRSSGEDQQLRAGHALRRPATQRPPWPGAWALVSPKSSRPALLQLRIRCQRRTGSSSAATTKSTSFPSASTSRSSNGSPSPQAHRPRLVFSRAARSAKSFFSTRRTAVVIATASSSAMKRSSPTRCANSRARRRGAGERQ